MNRGEFINCLALYGSDVGRWPEEIRADAYAACENSTELQKLMEEEGRFEDLLDSLPFEDATSDLAERIIMSADRRPVPEQGSEKTGDLGLFFTELFFRFFTLKPAMGLALTLIIGVVLGYADPLAADLSEGVDIGSFLYNGEDLP